LRSPDDLSAKYETYDQVVEALVRKPLIKELLRRDLRAEVPFARPFGKPGILHWHTKIAASLRAARKKHERIPDPQLILNAMHDESSKFPCPSRPTNDALEESWYKTYHRSQQMLRVQNGISDDSVPVCNYVGR